jgi:hypothetical protein
MSWRCLQPSQFPVHGDGETGGGTGHEKKGLHVKPIARTAHDPQPSGRLADRALWEGVAVKALCADGSFDPDEWFPVCPTRK